VLQQKKAHRWAVFISRGNPSVSSR